MDCKEMRKIVMYAAKVIPLCLKGKPTSLGCDIAIAQLRDAAGLELSQREMELLEYDRKCEGLADIIEYAANVIPFSLEGKPTSTGYDISIARLKNAAGLELSERQADLIDRHDRS